MALTGSGAGPLLFLLCLVAVLVDEVLYVGQAPDNARAERASVDVHVRTVVPMR